MAGSARFPISVVIPTIHRGRAIERTIDSVTGACRPPFEIIIVDQSADSELEKCLQGRPPEDGLRYFRIPARGVAAARNFGVRRARCDLVALTDDDCLVSPDWLRNIVEAFAAEEQVAMVFGNVVAGPHDPEKGFVQAYLREAPFVARGVEDKHRAEGIGASMALRKRIWAELGGFDEELGAGSEFRSAEETDLALRALMAGHWIYETPKASVVHTGFRSWEESPRMVWDYLYGLGAMSGKHLRRPGVPAFLVRLAYRWAFQEPLSDLGRRPPRVLRLRAFLRGLAAGATAPADKRSGLFLGRNMLRPYIERQPTG